MEIFLLATIATTAIYHVVSSALRQSKIVSHVQEIEALVRAAFPAVLAVSGEIRSVTHSIASLDKTEIAVLDSVRSMPKNIERIREILFDISLNTVRTDSDAMSNLSELRQIARDVSNASTEISSISRNVSSAAMDLRFRS